MKNNIQISKAKINLLTKIYPTVISGKHKIKSLFFKIDYLYDEIFFINDKKFSVKYLFKSKELNIKDCLLTKVYKYFVDKYKIKFNYKIIVNKNIPIGSGLGGGSSNAGTLIKKIVEKNKGIKLDYKEIAIKLGSDIPFFIYDYNQAIVSNLGDKVKQVKFKPKFKISLINLNFLSSTKKVFDKLSKDKNYQSVVNFEKEFKNIKENKINLIKETNDLEKYFLQLNPQVKKFFQENKGGKKILSGTGSSIILLK